MPRRTILHSARRRISRIGLPLSVTVMGRPSGVANCFCGSTPSSVAAVAMRSGTVVGRVTTLSPSSLVAPRTTPPRTPPPASTALHAAGWWSRPSSSLILGVRPNSPMHTTSVESRSLRSPRSREERGQRRIERAHELLGAAEVVLVRVPAVEHDLDEAHAGLDEAARHEAAAAEVGVAVGARDGVGLVGEVERLEPRRVHHADGARVDGAARLDLGVAGARGEVVLERVERLLALEEAHHVHAGRVVGVLQRLLQVLHDERVVLHAEKAGRDARPADADERRQIGGADRRARARPSRRATGRRRSGWARSRCAARCCARSWLPSLLVMPRRTARCCATSATRGRCSES